MFDSGFGSTSFRSLELSLLSVCRSGVLEVIAKSSATFGDIGDGVESPGRMTAVGGEDVYHGRCRGEGRGLLRLFPFPYPDSTPDRLPHPDRPPRPLSMTDRTPTTSSPKIL